MVLHSNDKSLKVKLHPAVFDLGIKYANGTIRGANARCRAMMETFKVSYKSTYETTERETEREREIKF